MAHDDVALGPVGQAVGGTLQALLAGYDAVVGASLEHALAASPGLDRVRVVHNEVRPSLVVHDAVVEAVLCPRLERRPGGTPVAARLRAGCAARAELLGRFGAVSEQVAAHNVYPVAGAEVDEVLDGLQASFAVHAHDETAEVAELLGAAAAGELDELAAEMAAAARRSPTRHPMATSRWRAPALVTLRRWGDRVSDWSDTHWNWSDPRRLARSPRGELVDVLRREAGSATPSVRAVLERYDAAVEAVAAELVRAGDPETEALAGRRVAAAIAIHDAVVGGVLCPLLDSVAGGPPVAARLRAGCVERAALRQRLEQLGRRDADGSPEHRAAASAVLAELVERFRDHERDGTREVEAVLGPLPDAAYRTASSALDDVMWPWHSEGPAVLALRMALWGESAPTRAHPAVVRHPESRAVRSLYHLADEVRTRPGDSWVERWLFPELPRRPIPGERAAGMPPTHRVAA